MPQLQEWVQDAFTNTGSTYDGLVLGTTLGGDALWKARMFSMIPQNRRYDTIIDLASGTGLISIPLAIMFPNSQILGVDLMPEYIKEAEAKKQAMGLKNVQFFHMDAESLPENWKADLVVTNYLPKYVNLDSVVNKLSRVMSPGGVLIFQDFTPPQDPLLKMGYDIYWNVLGQFLQSSPAYAKWGSELKTVVDQSSWVHDLTSALQRHGFSNIRVEEQPFQIATIVYAER